MALKTRPYDSAEYLRTPEAIAGYLNLAFEDGNPEVMKQALDVVARARARWLPEQAPTQVEFGDLQVVQRVLSHLGMRLQAAG